MNRSDGTILQMLQAAQAIMDFTAGLTFEEFRGDSKAVSAALYQLLNIGEASKRLEESFQRDHPEIPWTAIRGMRNVLVHQYDGIDLTDVWQTVVEDVPGLLAALDRLIPPKR